MSENPMADDMVMDLDLNQEPLDPSPQPLGSLLTDLETAHNRIGERIRQLEAVTARAWQRHTWRLARNPPPEPVVGPTGSDTRGKGCKRDSSHLVARALEMNVEVNKVGGDEGGSFFDCNICLDMARQPILTCCGHLFCWPCFYQLPYVDSTTKECPVCKGEVTDASVTPIYGNGDSAVVTELESGLRIPPRPQARRVESARQQRVTRGLSHIRVSEALRRIRNGLASLPQPQGADGSSFLNAESLTSRRLRSRIYTRVSSESAATLSSELEDLATSLRDRLLEMSNADVEVVPAVHDDGDSLGRDTGVVQLDVSSMGAVAETSSNAPVASSSQANQVSDTVVQLENLTTDSVSVPVGRSSLASRRRSILSMLNELDSGFFREPRRRRLN